VAQRHHEVGERLVRRISERIHGFRVRWET
jgi:hypothetical protein